MAKRQPRFLFVRSTNCFFYFSGRLSRHGGSRRLSPAKNQDEKQLQRSTRKLIVDLQNISATYVKDGTELPPVKLNDGGTVMLKLCDCPI